MVELGKQSPYAALIAYRLDELSHTLVRQNSPCWVDLCPPMKVRSQTPQGSKQLTSQNIRARAYGGIFHNVVIISSFPAQPTDLPHVGKPILSQKQGWRATCAQLLKQGRGCRRSRPRVYQRQTVSSRDLLFLGLGEVACPWLACVITIEVMGTNK